jgi:hypothetical protein
MLMKACCCTACVLLLRPEAGWPTMSSEDEDDTTTATETETSQTWREHFQGGGTEDASRTDDDSVKLAGGRLPRKSPFARKPMAQHAPAKVGFLNKKMTMMVMNRMHEPALRAIAAHYGRAGDGIVRAQIADLDTEGFECEMEAADGAKSSARVEFLEPLGGDVTAESMFIGMAKKAGDALAGQMEGIASEHEMVNIRHGQLEKGQETHVATLNCAAIVAELDEPYAGRDGVQTLAHVTGGGKSHLVLRPAATALLQALEPRIADGSLRLVLHDNERSATLLQRIFRRLDIGDGRTLHDLGVLCDAAQWGVSAHGGGRGALRRSGADWQAPGAAVRERLPGPSFKRCRDVLAIAPSLTLHCIDALSLDYQGAGERDHAIELRAWDPPQAVAVVESSQTAGGGSGSTAEEVREWLDTDASELRAAAEQIVATLDAAAAGAGTNLAKL